MRININIPSSWNELSDRQLKRIARHSHSNLSGALFDLKMFFALLDVRWWQFAKQWKVSKIIGNVGFSELKQHYKWLHSSLSLTRFIPTVKARKKALHGPADRMHDLTIDEFSHADDLYLGWMSAQDFEYLQYLAAVLYRELDERGKRVPFDKTELEARARHMGKLDKQTLLAIALSYQGARSYLIAQFPIAFPKPKDTVKTPRSSNFGKLALHLSGGKFGTHNETKNTNVYTFLSEFEEQLKNKPYA